MTLAELQPIVDAALTSLEWETARARWRDGLRDEAEALTKALPLAGSYGVEAAPLEARLSQIALEAGGDVTADRVPLHPLRSVPMDMITSAVVRRILRVPAAFPIVSIKAEPDAAVIQQALASVARHWQTPNGSVPSVNV